MALRLMIFAVRAVEITFFTGLIGCVVVVVMSWISVGGDAFSRDTELELRPPEARRRAR